MGRVTLLNRDTQLRALRGLPLHLLRPRYFPTSFPAPSLVSRAATDPAQASEDTGSRASPRAAVRTREPLGPFSLPFSLLFSLLAPPPSAARGAGRCLGRACAPRRGPAPNPAPGQRPAVLAAWRACVLCRGTDREGGGPLRTWPGQTHLLKAETAATVAQARGRDGEAMRRGGAERPTCRGCSGPCRTPRPGPELFPSLVHH